MNKSSTNAMLANIRINPRVVVQNIMNRFTDTATVEEVGQARWRLGAERYARLEAYLKDKVLREVLDRI